MKIVVINLDHRTDRLEFMAEQLKGFEWSRQAAFNGHNMSLEDFKQHGFEPYKKWVDPMLERPHTLTDIAAMASHYMVWSDCAINNEPVLILEDDARLVRELNLREVEDLLESYDVVYLDHREMFDKKVVNVSDKFVRPYYPYWNDAYAISPRLAKRLISSPYKTNLIPVDEFFPLINGVNYNETCLSAKGTIRGMFDDLVNIFKSTINIASIAYKNPIFKQVPRSVLGSDIENGPRITNESEKIMTSNQLKILTVATDISKLNYLEKSKKLHKFEYENLGAGVKWGGGDMSGPGGGQKINIVKEKLRSLSDDDVVLFVDGYDVFINDAVDTILKRYQEFGADIVIAAEKACWPDANMASRFTESHTDYKYPNSGVYIGTVKSLKKFFEKDIANHEDDQLYVQKQYLKNQIDQDINVKLDFENYLFQCLANAEADITTNRYNQLLNTNTRCCPCILHGNGGNSTKASFDNIVNKLISVQSTNTSTSQSGVEMIKNPEMKALDTDILELDFLTPENCSRLIKLAEAHGKWESMYGDKFPGQEIRIREFSMHFWNELETHFKTTINPLIEKHWWPLLMYGLRDAFIIKYDQNTQSNLKCHHDASLVSGLVKLNDGYTGGDTYFYRQNFSNINTPIGKMILWPGQVTHGHEGRTVHTGTKYNLVIWTSRHRGDINY